VAEIPKRFGEGGHCHPTLPTADPASQAEAPDLVLGLLGGNVKRRVFEVAPGEAGPLGRLLAARLAVSVAEVEALVRRGAVYVRGRRVLASELPVAAGERVLVVLTEGGRSVLAEEPEPPALRILYQDAYLLAVDKPAGLPAQATPGGATGLAALASAHLARPAGLVHRLDRETTGITLFGVTPTATAALAASFRAGRVKKQYLAAAGPALPDQGTIELPLSRDPSRPGRWRATHLANGIAALTEFRRLGGGAGYSLAALWPRTGRTHQLRAHLAALGAPILGDVRYGGARHLGSDAVGRCLLHAHALRFPHPERGELLTLVADVPTDLGRLFARGGVAVPEAAWVDGPRG
jgi:23S rRNA pseudouridine1911/1915/1917 synthase